MASHTATTERRLFRQHTQTGHLNTPLLLQLCHEWAELHRSPTTAATISRWHDTFTALAGLHSPGAHCRRGASQEAAPDLALGALTCTNTCSRAIEKRSRSDVTHWVLGRTFPR